MGKHTQRINALLMPDVKVGDTVDYEKHSWTVVHIDDGDILLEREVIVWKN